MTPLIGDTSGRSVTPLIDRDTSDRRSVTPLIVTPLIVCDTSDRGDTSDRDGDRWTGNLLATSLSRETIRDAPQVSDLFETYTGPLASLTGDRGYDQASVYREALGRNVNASIITHPRINGTHSRRKLELKRPS